MLLALEGGITVGGTSGEIVPDWLLVLLVTGVIGFIGVAVVPLVVALEAAGVPVIDAPLVLLTEVVGGLLIGVIGLAVAGALERGAIGVPLVEIGVPVMDAPPVELAGGLEMGAIGVAVPLVVELEVAPVSGVSGVTLVEVALIPVMGVPVVPLDVVGVALVLVGAMGVPVIDVPLEVA